MDYPYESNGPRFPEDPGFQDFIKRQDAQRRSGLQAQRERRPALDDAEAQAEAFVAHWVDGRFDGWARMTIEELRDSHSRGVEPGAAFRSGPGF